MEGVPLRIFVKYSCPLCGLFAVPCSVPARGEEDVRAWVEQTIHLVAEDHARRSPSCHPKRLHNLMIPMAGSDRIGGPVMQ